MTRPVGSALALLSCLCALDCGGSRAPLGTPGQPHPARPSAAVAPASVPPPRDNGRLPGGITPTAYRWKLAVDPGEPGFSGTMHISVRVARATRAVVLHGRGLDIRSADIVVPSGRLPAVAAFRRAANSKGEADELVLTTASEIPAGDAAVEISYDAPFAPGLAGLYRVEDGGKKFAFTQFEPVGARLAMPCFDEPGFKVPFEIALTIPSRDVALSNMPESKRLPSADHTHVTIDFQRTPPLPTYLVALAVGPIELVSGAPVGDVPLRLGAVPGRAALGGYALGTAHTVLAILERYFGSSYPYPKLDLLAVPNFAAGAMENAGLVTFREELLLLDDATASTSMRRAVAGTIAHELSHMWFGDLVTLAWWNDIWLNEGFATWMATHVLDAYRPEFGAGVDELGRVAHVLDVDTLASARKVRQPVRSTTDALEAFDGITYEKGAALLGMVERWISPDVFRRGVTEYISQHRFGNATAADLFSALGQASGKDVAGVLGSFTEQTGVPAVKVSGCHLEKGKPVVDLAETEYRPLGAPAPTGKRWHIPVCLHVAGRSGGDRACGLIAGDAARVALPGSACPRWVQPNADQAGYYRATVPFAELGALAALPRGALAVRERVGLLLDAWALVESGAAEAGDFLSLSQRFRGDPEHAVWQRIIDSLEFLADDVVADSDRPALAAFAERLLGPEAHALGWEPIAKEPEENRIRRRLVLEGLGRIARDESTIAKARAVTDRWLADPRSVDGEAAQVALELAAANGDEGLFERLRARLTTAETPFERVLALTALSSFTDPVLVRRALELVLTGAVRVQDQIYIFRGVFGRSETRDVAFQFVAEHADEVLARIPPFARGRMLPLFARGCSEADAERARAVFGAKLGSIEGADRGFAEAEEETHRCAAFRERHRAPLGVWLSSTGRTNPSPG